MTGTLDYLVLYERIPVDQSVSEVMMQQRLIIEARGKEAAQLRSILIDMRIRAQSQPQNP
jgi:hypothetical protein